MVYGLVCVCVCAALVDFACIFFALICDIVLVASFGGGGGGGGNMHIFKLLLNDSMISNDKCALILLSLSHCLCVYVRRMHIAIHCC